MKKNNADQNNDCTAMYIYAGAKPDGIINIACVATTVSSAWIRGHVDDFLEPFVKALEELRKLEP